MRSLLDNIFALGIMGFVALGTILVIVQAIGIITLDGQMAIWAKAAFAKKAFIIAALTGVLGFVLSYLHGWKLGD